jgi:hypothetical protein
MIRKTLTLLTIVVGLTAAAKAQTIGVSAASDCGKLLGPYMPIERDGSIEGFNYKGFTWTIAFDKNRICQAVVVTTNNGQFSTDEIQMIDSLCLPEGQYTWKKVLSPILAGEVVQDCFYAEAGQDNLIVMGAIYQVGNRLLVGRMYGTLNNMQFMVDLDALNSGSGMRLIPEGSQQGKIARAFEAQARVLADQNVEKLRAVK